MMAPVVTHHILPLLPLDVDLHQVVVALDKLLRVPDPQHQRLALPGENRDIS